MPLLYPPSRLLRSPFFPISLTLNTDHQRACASHVTPSFLTDDKIARSRLRDSGESEKSFKNKKTRGGWGETLPPLPPPLPNASRARLIFALLV